MKRSPGLTQWLTAMLAVISLTAAAQESMPGANVASLLDYARTHNPEYAVMRFEAEAAGERVQPAGALPDPTLRVEWMDVTNRGQDAAPSLLPSRVGSTKYTVIQPLPFWGKRDLKRDVASADAESARATASAMWIDLASRVKAAYAEYYRANVSVKLTREILDLVARIAQVAQARYASGLVPQQDVLRAQVEQTAMTSELIG
ncbi:MAG: TolC family protein, partial [Sterolibacterium sp.]